MLFSHKLPTRTVMPTQPEKSWRRRLGVNDVTSGVAPPAGGGGAVVVVVGAVVVVVGGGTVVLRNHFDAVRLADAGYDAMLVGETLVTSPDPTALLRKLRGGT